MNLLENELGKLLQRKEPPEGFAGRVLARMGTEPSQSSPDSQKRRSLFPWSWRVWAAAAAACLILAVSSGVLEQRARHRQAEADLAGRQATLALEIASHQFNIAMQQAREATHQALAAATQK